MQHGRSDRRSLGFNMVLHGAPLSNFILIGSLIVLVGFVRESRSESDVLEPISETGPFDCMRLMLRGAKQIMKTMSRCSKEVKASTANNREFAEKIGCVMKCIMFRINMTTPDYLITAESMLPLLKRFLPNDLLINDVHEYMVDNCGQLAAKVEPNDDKCNGYAQYSLCMQTAFEKFMNTSPNCIKKKKKGESETT